MHDLNISWDACVQSKRPVNPAIISLWVHPPEGVLKPNFDGELLEGGQKRRLW